MNVCILGLARSGTTVLYSLLQEILMDNYGQNVEFVYEPFLWERDCFNDIFEHVSKYFEYMDSISINGIYNHLKLPLLIENPDQYKKNEYLNNLFESSSERQNILLKFIRACGRYLLLYTISPETKFIFKLRNPADSANSIAANFSFYGGEFHRDDFSRFIIEVNRVFGKSYKKEEFDTRLEKDLFYWNHMNRFALQSFTKTSLKPLILCHEDILKNRNKYLQDICDYLQVSVKPKYKDLLLEKVGPVTTKHEASEKELKMYEIYLDKYTQMLKDHGIPHSFKKDEILRKYKITKEPVEKSPVEYGSIPLAIMKKLEEEKIKNTHIHNQKQKLIDEQQKELNKKNVLVLEKDKQLLEKGKQLVENDKQLVENDKQLLEKDKQLKEKNALIAKKDDQIKQKENESKLKDENIKKIEEQIIKKNELIIHKDHQAKQALKNFEEKEAVLKNKLALSVEKEQLQIVRIRQIKNEYEKKLHQIFYSYSFRLGSRIIKFVKFFVGWLPFIKKKIIKKN